MDKKPDKEKKGEKGKSHPPGADYVEAEKKPSRRSGKNKNKPTDAGPLVTSAPPHPPTIPGQAGLTKVGLQMFHHHPLLNQAMNQAHLLKDYRQCTFLND